MKRKAAATIAVCLMIAVGIAAYAGVFDKGTTNVPQALSLNEPGDSYEMVTTRYEYYGDLKKAIECDPSNSMGVEWQVFTIQIRVAPDGESHTVSISAADIDGNSLSATDMNGEQITGTRYEAGAPENEWPDLVRAYLALGYTEVGVDPSGGRIFEFVARYSEAEKHGLSLPIQDLNPVSTLVEVNIDTRKNIRTGYYRYVSDEASSETLVESWVTTIARLD